MCGDVRSNNGSNAEKTSDILSRIVLFILPLMVWWNSSHVRSFLTPRRFSVSAHASK